MMAFFTNQQEKRVQVGKWLMFSIILLLCVLQAFTLYQILYNTKDDYEDRFFSILVEKTKHLCLIKSSSAPPDYLSYSYRTHSISIRKHSLGSDTLIYLPRDKDSDVLICQGDYDIRDTSLWSLDSLGSLLTPALQLQKLISAYSLTLTDLETNKILAQYRQENSSLPLWIIRRELPLGFLEHHLLTAEFVYPLSHFWPQVWDKVITSLGMFLLLIVFTRSLFVQLRNEKKAGEYRKKFTHTLVHNLRSPLIFLKQQLDCIDSLNASPEAQRAALNKCQEKTETLLKSIEQLLSTSVNAYGLVAQTESFDLTALVQKMAKAYRQNQPDKTIDIRVDSRLDHPVYADPTLLEGALGNLIGNAIKYSGPDTRIRIGCREEHRKVILTVSDNGPGIPPEEQSYIFDENYRGKRYISDRRHKGFGLGLYYVRAVTLAHRGQISVRSDGQDGTEFTIELPQKHRKS